MDESSIKRSGRRGFSRSSSSLSFKEPNHEDRNIRHCNRLGCSTRLNSMKGSPVGSPEKSRYPKTPYRSVSSRHVGGSSSKPFVASDRRKSYQQQPNRISSRDKILPDANYLESHTAQRVTSFTTESSSSTSRKRSSRWGGSNSQGIPSSSSSVQRPNAAINRGQVTKLKNPSFSLVSGVLPSGCSSNLGPWSKRVSSVRKRPSDGQSSSSGGRIMSGSSTCSLPGMKPMPQQALQRPKNKPLNRERSVSTRALRVEARTRLPGQQDDNNSHAQLTISEEVSESSLISFSIESPPIFPRPFGRRPRSCVGGSQNRLVSSHLEDEPFRERDGYRHVNMEGIAEVLLALERIEQDDVLTYEQFLVPETNLLVGGFSFHDQHRDMRLDIDNMTYEELLALEEKMGTVSTALSNEVLSKCIKRSSYIPAFQCPSISAHGDEDIKCSICQEEYVIGDEVGKLACNHAYHADCIHGWLKQKNFCPICRTTAASLAEETRG